MHQYLLCRHGCGGLIEAHWQLFAHEPICRHAPAVAPAAVVDVQAWAKRAAWIVGRSDSPASRSSRRTSGSRAQPRRMPLSATMAGHAMGLDASSATRSSSRSLQTWSSSPWPGLPSSGSMAIRMNAYYDLLETHEISRALPNYLIVPSQNQDQ